MSFYVRHFDDRTAVLCLPDYQVCFVDKTPDLASGIHQQWHPTFPAEWQTEHNSKQVQFTRDEPPQPDWPWRQLYIIATGRCNLACRYCAQGRGEAGNMPIEMMLARTTEFSRKSPKPEGIVFYGGEPLLNWKALRETISLVWRENPTVEITLFTNGALVTDEIAAFLAECKVGVILSLDGDAISHDAARPLRRDNTGSYRQCVEGYRRLRERGCMVGISCVIGPHNAERISAITHHLCSLRPVNIGMNPLHVPGRSGYAFSPEDSAGAIIAAARISAEYRIEIEQVARRLRSFVYEKPRRGDCPACGARLVVTPEGYYGPCEGAYPFRPEWFFATQAESKALSRRLAAWPCSNPECASCEAIGLCGGGCVLDAYLTAGCLTGLDQRTCHLAKAVLRFALEELECNLPEHNTVIPVETKQQVFANYLTKMPRPLQSSSRFGERTQ